MSHGAESGIIMALKEAFTWTSEKRGGSLFFLFERSLFSPGPRTAGENNFMPSSQPSVCGGMEGAQKNL